MPRNSISRRALLGGVAAAAGGVVVYGCGIEPSWLEVTLHEHHVDRLPRTMEGFTIAQVTDAHLKTIGAVEQAIAEALGAHGVHLLVLSGDLIDTSARVEMLREFCGRVARKGMAIVATLGNWEHWAKIEREALTNAYTSTGVRLLVNEALTSEGLRIFGTDDATGGYVRLNRLVVAEGRPTLLVTHSPDLFDRLPKALGPIALSVAGHTHGGQVRLGAGAAPFVPPGSGRFVSGWYDVPVGRAYVSRGTGTSILPARFTCRPELPIFRLKRA